MNSIISSIIAAALAMFVGLSNAGSTLVNQGFSTWYAERIQMEIEKNKPVFTMPEVNTDFTEDFFQLGTEKAGIEYDGNMFEDLYDFGKYEDADISKLTMTLRVTPVEGGEFIDFLNEYFIGQDAEAELRAVTVDGKDEPYQFLYVRLHYPDKYFTDGSYSDLYDMEYELLLTACNDALLKNGIERVMFSMYDSSEMKVMSITTQENGQFYNED